MITIENIRAATCEQIDEILAATEYADKGVALGDAAAADQDLRRAARKELNRRVFGDCAPNSKD